jgi:alpha-N-arabinofuranosidase
MDARIRCSGEAAHAAPETLIGHNLEACGDVIQGMLSDRLSNPKFRGPANADTGIAPGWQPNGNNYSGVRYELTPGMSLSGNESQLVDKYSPHGCAGLVQIDRKVGAGERFEVEIWARAKHRPVGLQLGLSPLPARKPWYDRATVNVDATYWKPYRATLAAPCDDDEAVFHCMVEGRGVVWIDQIHMRPEGEGPLSRQMLERIRTLRIPALRFPGGCVSTNYHWRHGTGPVHLRPELADPVFKWVTSYDFGTDEYLELCRAQGMRPHITLNIGSGTPEEAGAWAAYCAEWFRSRGEEPPPAYFQMGNEHYLLGEPAHMTGEMYVEALREFVPPVRRAYPAARIIALGATVSHGFTKEEETPWREVVLDKAPDLCEVIALQLYHGRWHEDAEQRMAEVGTGIAGVSGALRAAIKDCNARNLDTRVAVTEWNFWLHASHWDGKGFLEPYDVQHGMYVSGMLNEFTRLAPGLELANFYNLVNVMGFLAHRGRAVEDVCLGDVFRLHRPAFPGEVLPVEVDSPALAVADGEPPAAVDAAALRTPEGTFLFIGNRSPTEPARVRIEGLADGSSDGEALVGEDPLGQFRKEETACSGGAAELPPLTLARLRF